MFYTLSLRLIINNQLKCKKTDFYSQWLRYASTVLVDTYITWLTKKVC